MCGLHLSLPSPTYRNLLGWNYTHCVHPVLPISLGEGWGPAPVWCPVEFPGG